MYCNHCGQNLPEQAAFCSNCGQRTLPGAAPGVSGMTAPAADPARGRTSRHRNTLAILWIIYSLLKLPGVLIMLGLGTSLPWMMHQPWMHGMQQGGLNGWVPGVAAGWMEIIGWVLLVSLILGLILAFGLMQKEGWARIYGIVIGILALLSIPFGTALGIYTLWVLAPQSSELEWRQTARL